MVRQVNSIDASGYHPVNPQTSKTFNCKKVQALGLKIGNTIRETLLIGSTSLFLGVALMIVVLGVGIHNSIRNSFNMAMLGLKNAHLAK